MQLRYFLLSLCCVLPCVWPGPPRGLADAPALSPAGERADGLTPNLFCGPRCVQYVLAHYGGALAPLPEIVKEVQWPDVRAGASLSAIQRVLGRHQVRTSAVRVPSSCVLVANHPYIVHLRPETPTALGHYVVVLPGASRWRMTVWDGGVLAEVPSWELAGRASGFALLTAPGSEETPRAEAVMTGDAAVLRCGYLLAGLIGVNIVGGWLRRRFVRDLGVRTSPVPRAAPALAQGPPAG